MKINELRPGDILLFSSESESPILETITYLTKSPVSHVAMVYTDASEIIEESPPAVQLSNTKDRINGGKAAVLRHHPMKETYAPVLDVASKYLNYSHPYAHGSLYVLGLLLLYKRFIPGPSTQQVMVKIFKKMASELLDYLHRFMYPGKSPMCCAQFVYRCYEEAGDEYHLDIAKGSGCNDETGSVGDSCLLRQVIHKIKSDISDEFRSYILDYSDRDLGVEITQSDDELASELLTAIQTEHDHNTVELDNDLVVAVHEFSQAVYQAMTGISIDYNELEHANRIGMATSGLSLLCIEESDFITPNDLLYNCANLRQVGEVGT